MQNIVPGYLVVRVNWWKGFWPEGDFKMEGTRERDQNLLALSPNTFATMTPPYLGTLSQSYRTTETYQFTSYKYLNMTVFVEKPLSLSANAKYRYINIFIYIYYIHNKKVFIYFLPNTCVHDFITVKTNDQISA